MRALVITLLFTTATAAMEPAVPSGQTVALFERIVEADDVITWRYRYIAPAIARDGGTVSLDAALADIEALCDSDVLADVELAAEPPATIVITLMDRAIPFGNAAPEATQYIEAFRIKADRCIWEAF